MAETEPIEITIRLAATPSEGFEGFVAKLSALGLGEIERRDRFLMVLGRGPARLIDEIKRLPGVAAVRRSKEFGSG